MSHSDPDLYVNNHISSSVTNYYWKETVAGTFDK